MLEQPGAELDTQDPAHRVVDLRHGDLALGEQLLAEVDVVGAHHLHVGAGVERHAGGIGAVGRDAVAA